MKPAFRVLFAFVLALMLCAPAKADILTFYGDDLGAALTPAQAETQFQSNLTGVAIEDFSSGSTIDFGNGITAAISTGYYTGSKWHITTSSFILTFSEAISAFGLFLYDLDYSANLAARYNDTLLDIPNPVIGGGLSNDEHFWGVIDTGESFTQLTISGSTLEIELDNMQIGIPNVRQSGPVATPEPSTFLLLAAGLGGVAFLRRKRA